MHPISEELHPVEAQETQPLLPLGIHPFQVYLDQQQLSWSAVAREADVRYLLIWNSAHGVSIPGRQVIQIRAAVHRLCGVAYTGPMNTHVEEPNHKPQQAVALIPAWEIPQ